MADLVIPKTSFDTLNRVLRAYYLTHSEMGVSIKEVAHNTGYIEAQIAKSNKFLIEIGFLTKADGKFKLTEKGHDYADNMRENNIKEANEILFNTIRDYSGIQLITNFVDVFGGVTKEQLATRIEEISSSKRTIADHRTGINCFIEMLLNSGILIQSEDRITLESEVQ